MAAFLCKIVLFCALLTVLLAQPTKQDDIRNWIETLQSSYDKKIVKLTELIEDNEKECERKVSLLEQRIMHLETENKKMIDENSNNKNEILSLSRIATDMSKKMGNKNNLGLSSSARTHSMNVDRDNIDKYQQMYDTRTDRALNYEVNIAFTAYLDHDLDRQTQDQTVIFNRVLLNDGDGYSNTTGIFTVPMTGVYSLTFFLGQRNPNEVRAYLVVNNQHKVDAAVETLHNYQDLQGGNTANLHLNKGDTVYITHQGAGTHIEGDDNLRTTTFSGFLIYPVEAINIVG